MASSVIIIEPGREAKNYWLDLWRYRELMYFLAWRDIAVRYKQTLIGIAWAVIRPALMMLVFIAFRRMAGLPPGSAPEPILVLAAVLPWQFFSVAVTESSASLIGNANLISKVYFPRLIIPCAAVTTSLIDFFITLSMLVLIMLCYDFWPGWEFLFLPFFIFLTLAISTGLGIFLSALNVEYRDFRYVIPFVIQFGSLVSPIAFQTVDVPAQWQWLYMLNPIVGVIDGFRWCVLGTHSSLTFFTVAASVCEGIGFLLLGLSYFRRMERGFADVI